MQTDTHKKNYSCLIVRNEQTLPTLPNQKRSFILLSSSKNNNEKLRELTRFTFRDVRNSQWLLQEISVLFTLL